jgi:glycosyltransferase involved in cell wall biosynthesis
VQPRVPGARLRVIGDGSRSSLVGAAARDGLVAWDRRLRPDEVARALDEARVLVLPSRSEGMGRVILEANLRGRPVVGTAVGGIVDLVEDGRTGLLVPPHDTRALAAALERILSDHGLAERLASPARESARRRVATPEEYADSVRAVVERVTA